MHIADVISLSEIWDWFKVYFWSNMTPPARSTGNQNKRRSPNITPGRSPYYPLSPDDERYTIFISIALYYVAVFIMVPAMKAYYWREKNVTITTDDLQEIILIFKNENKNNPGFLRYLFSNEDMFWLNATRNQINHEDLSQIFANWKDDFWVLRHLCRCMGDRQAELEVIRIFNLVNSGNAREAVRLRFNFSQSDPYYVVLCLTHILYVVLVKYLAKNLWHFLLSKRHPSSSFNPYKNAPLINHWEITDFPLIYFSMILGIKIGTWLSLTMHWLIIDLSWDYWMINADFLLIVKWYSLISHWIFHDYHVISDW